MGHESAAGCSKREDSVRVNGILGGEGIHQLRTKAHVVGPSGPPVVVDTASVPQLLALGAEGQGIGVDHNESLTICDTVESYGLLKSGSRVPVAVQGEDSPPGLTGGPLADSNASFLGEATSD